MAKGFLQENTGQGSGLCPTGTRRASGIQRVKYLLDTDICIAILRGISTAVEHAKAISPDDLAVSAITRYELQMGVLRCAPKRRKLEARKVESFLSLLHELPFTSETAKLAAEVRHRLESCGKGIGPMDTLIAATAIEGKLTLVTGNLREFIRVEGLPCEDWSDLEQSELP